MVNRAAMRRSRAVSARIGFGTDHGTVAAADDWGGQMRVKSVLPARPDSWEFAFRKAGLARSLTDWRRADRRELIEALRESRLERAISVVYRPQTEFTSHYFEAVMAQRFDAYVWFEETGAVAPLPAGRPRGAAETYPFGL
jgi:erythromycin esterase-like protein